MKKGRKRKTEKQEKCLIWSDLWFNTLRLAAEIFHGLSLAIRVSIFSCFAFVFCELIKAH